MEKGNRCETFAFHLNLLLEVEEMKKYPFTKLVIEKSLTRKEYMESLQLLEILNERYEEDVANGLINHADLMIHFAGMLCYKLPIEETLEALEQQGLYPELTSLLNRLHYK
ncbi:DUF1878 family protein [Halobacillus faecis]|uniref:DUF1878 domain-containing protein n=1 Tax=Halobacillus faecis TaxID=360184 RepID=A0A511WPC6_9BACI|nr:DUF1878 family protein [Halobacillus faecis]GEN52989.1 hypothetical protein HFA01_12510 [Halobacillus faecis]